MGPVLGASLVILAREILSDYFGSWRIFVGLVYTALVAAREDVARRMTAT